MLPALIGKKIGMTRLYDETGRDVPVTIIEAGQCHVGQIKTADTDGYDAVQFAFEDIKARNSTMPLIGHDAKAGLGPRRFHREFRGDADQIAQLEAGAKVGVDVFEGVMFVDVSATSKGKGYSGVMKRWGFKGQPASHGTERKHRSPGSVGGRASNLGTGKPKKGIRMSGRHGNRRITTRSLEVFGCDSQRNLLLVKGAVPGPNRGLVMVRQSVRLSKTKARRAAAGKTD